MRVRATYFLLSRRDANRGQESRGKELVTISGHFSPYETRVTMPNFSAAAPKAGVSLLEKWPTRSRLRAELKTRSDFSRPTSLKPKPTGPVEAFKPAIVWRASQCGWLKIGKAKGGCDIWEKPNGERIIVRAGIEPLVPRKPASV